MEPPQLPEFQYRLSPPDRPMPRPPPSSRSFAQVEPPRVQEFGFQRSPPDLDWVALPPRPAGIYPGQLSSAPLPVAYMPQPQGVPMLPNSLPATTTKSSVVHERNPATIVREEVGSAASAQNVAIEQSTEWGCQEATRRREDSNNAPQRGISDSSKHSNTRNKDSGTAFTQSIR
jgi:hypothetical protein